MMGLTLLVNHAVAEDFTFNYDQAVERALSLDPRISEREKLVDVARGMLDEAKNSASWVYDFNAFLGVAPSIRGGFFEGQDGRFDPDSLDFEGIGPWYNLDFSVLRPLHTYGKIEHYSEAATNNIAIKQGDVRLEKAQVYMDITKAYYGYLAALDVKYMLEDSLDKLSGALSLVERWAQEGEGPQSDVYALQTGIALVHRFSAEMIGNERIAMAALKMLLGVKGEDTLKLADSRLRPVDLPEMTLAGLQQQALADRPEMQQVEAGLKARRALVAAKNAEAFPNVYAGIGGSFAYSPERAQTTDVAVYDPFNHAGLTPVLGLKWDWHSGVQEAQVKQAQAELNALVEKKSFALQGIPFQVAEAYHTVQAKHEMVQQMYEAARSGRRWMIATYADFEAGQEEASDVMNALQTYILAYGDYVRVVNDYNLSVAQLRVVTGEKP